MKDDAGKIFKDLIGEYQGKTPQERRPEPTPEALGQLWLNSETNLLYMASMDDEWNIVWKVVGEQSQVWI